MANKKMIGLRIKTMRQSRKMTQADLAKSIGQSQSSITMYETGRREPDFETLEALADVFNVPLVSLMIDPDAEPSPEHQRYSQYVDHYLFDKPLTKESRIISGGIDKMPPDKREQALKILQIAFSEYSDYFKEDPNDDA